MGQTRQGEISFNIEQEGEEILIHLIEGDNEEEYFTFTDDRIDIKPPADLNEKLYLRGIDPKILIKTESVEDTEEIAEDPPDEPRLVKKYLCNVCGGYFRLIRRHLESHGPHNCLDCLLNFKTEALYDDHLLTTHNRVLENYSCEDCSLGFSSLTNLALHKFEHTEQYTCPICNFTAKGRYRNSLINHIKRHEGKYSVKCEICGQGFVEKNILASHMEMHEAIPKYECEFCKKKFTVKRYLDVHKSYNHKKEMYGIEEVYQCEVCGRSFSFEKSLVRHLSCIHKIGEDRTVECSVCHKTIANNHNLKKHMRVHTGEKRFCCDTCGKAFSEKKYLKKHQNVHMRERVRKPRKLQEIESDEDSNFSTFVEDNIPVELANESVEYFLDENDIERNEVDDDEDNKDIFYFNV